MNKLFTENLPWKITSFVLAVVLWLFVINTQNPTQPQEISGISINITGLEQLEQAGYELTNKEEILSQNFKVIVSGPRLDVDKLSRNPQLITATLDLSGYLNDLTQDSIQYNNATYRVSMNIDSYGVTVKDKKPQVTKVLINKRDSKDQRVTYEIDKSITETYKLIGDGKPVISPEKVTISGKKTDIDRVSEAKVFITAENFSAEHLVNELPVVLLDADGNVIEGLEVSQEKVEVKLPIGTQKTVPVKVNVEGTVKDGYEINTIVSPSEVTIVGKADTLANIKEIELASIDLTNVTKTVLVQAELLLPEGVITLDDSKVSVCLEVQEEKSLNYPIPMNDLDLTVTGLGEGLTYEILTPSINVELSAVSNKLLSYTAADIKASLDLKGYSAGEYKLALTIIPPQGAKVMNEPINIDISINEQTIEPPPTTDGEQTENNTEKPPVEEEDNQHIASTEE